MHDFKHLNHAAEPSSTEYSHYKEAQVLIPAEGGTECKLCEEGLELLKCPSSFDLLFIDRACHNCRLPFYSTDISVYGLRFHGPGSVSHNSPMKKVVVFRSYIVLAILFDHGFFRRVETAAAEDALLPF